jgi:hypothetical protein
MTEEQRKKKLVERLFATSRDVPDMSSDTVSPNQTSANLADYARKAYGNNYGKELAKATAYTDKKFPKHPTSGARIAIPERFSKQSFFRRDQEGIDFKVPVVMEDIPVQGDIGVAGKYVIPPQQNYALSYNKEGEKIIADPQTNKVYDTSVDDVIEHEVGHAVYPYGAYEALESVDRTKDAGEGAIVTHLTRPLEAINVLGKVTRQYFKNTGERFTEQSLEKYISSENKKKPEQRFKGFTTDAQNMLEALRRSYSGEYKEDKGSFFKDSAKLIPALVKNEEPKSFEDAVNKRMA